MELKLLLLLPTSNYLLPRLAACCKLRPVARLTEWPMQKKRKFPLSLEVRRGAELSAWPARSLGPAGRHLISSQSGKGGVSPECNQQQAEFEDFSSQSVRCNELALTGQWHQSTCCWLRRHHNVMGGAIGRRILNSIRQLNSNSRRRPLARRPNSNSFLSYGINFLICGLVSVADKL